MEYFHSCQIFIDKDVRIATLHILAHMIGYYITQRIEAFAHICRIWR